MRQLKKPLKKSFSHYFISMKKLLFVLSTILIVSGCQGTSSPIDDLFEGRKIDYRNSESQKQTALKYPPNVLTEGKSISSDSISVKEYLLENIPTPDELIKDYSAVGVHYMKDGDRRWIEVDASANQVWERTLDFWENDLGFPVIKQSKRNGIIETDWLDIRDKIPVPGDDFFTPLVSDLFDRISDSGERDKFVTRLEITENNKVQVYVAHQHIVAVFDDGLFSSYQRFPKDDGVEVEMLRRLMYTLAKTQFGDTKIEVIDQQIATEETEEQPSDYVLEGEKLVIKKTFKDAWNIVQIGLNRGGFSIEDRLIVDKKIFIKYGGGIVEDALLGAKKKNFFSKLISGDDPEFYELALTFNEVDDNTSSVEIYSASENLTLTPQQKETILKIIHSYLPQ